MEPHGTIAWNSDELMAWNDRKTLIKRLKKSFTPSSKKSARRHVSLPRLGPPIITQLPTLWNYGVNKAGFCLNFINWINKTLSFKLFRTAIKKTNVVVTSCQLVSTVIKQLSAKLQNSGGENRRETRYYAKKTLITSKFWLFITELHHERDWR